MKRRHGIVLALLAIGLAPGVHGEWTQAEVDAGCVVFQYSPMKNLSPAFVPSREIVAEKLSCVLARNEYESIQFGVHALTDDIEAIEVAVATHAVKVPSAVNPGWPTPGVSTCMSFTA